MAKAPAKNTAKPGSKEPKAAKEKVERIQYDIPEGGLTAVPEDWDRKVHKPLLRKDFKEEAIYFEMRADELEKKAKALRKQAEDSRKLGGVKEKAKAKRLMAMQKRMAELKEELAAQGINVDELLEADDS